MSVTKTLLMNTMDAKIKQVHRDLAKGWHNPEMMEEIGFLLDVIKLVTRSERRLLSELDDID